MVRRSFGIALLMACGLATAAHAILPTPSEMAAVRAWLPVAPAAGSVPPPFSFIYGGRSSAELLPTWDASSELRRLGAHRMQHTLVWRDPATQLVVRCIAVEYGDSPTIEWTLWFENDGPVDSPILEAIQALDVRVEPGASGDVRLRHNNGSYATDADYEPLDTPLEPGMRERFGALGGRPTWLDLPYFNLDRGRDGLIVVVGWPGQWTAEFARELDGGVTVTAGQETTHFRLKPGERVRSPLIVLQTWTGGAIRGQNLWRRWMIAHNLPRTRGRSPQPRMLANSSRAFTEMEEANEANQIEFIDRYRRERVGVEAWWMDAGWYPSTAGWSQTGTWTVDRQRFPNGLRSISDHAHSAGMQTVLWFEPERVMPGTWLAENHPEWVLPGEPGGLLDLGNPAAWQWLAERLDTLLTENAIDVYRQDSNIAPLSYWLANDAPDRLGITEIAHVTGYLALWDELRRRHPDLQIDACASGGARNDLETLRRAVPLWRSDHVFDPVGTQSMTYALSAWIPYHGTGTVAWGGAPYYGAGWTPVEPYAFWSNAAPSIVWGLDVREEDLDYAAIRRLATAWRQVNRYYSGDFYPLTPHSLRDDAWMAWQFHRPKRGDGLVQAFRRADASHANVHLKLNGLQPSERYRVRDVTTGGTWTASGRRLMRPGLRVRLTDPPAAKILVYERVPKLSDRARDD